jgi:hypothetical protein
VMVKPFGWKTPAVFAALVLGEGAPGRGRQPPTPADALARRLAVRTMRAPQLGFSDSFHNDPGGSRSPRKVHAQTHGAYERSRPFGHEGLPRPTAPRCSVTCPLEVTSGQ